MRTKGLVFAVILVVAIFAHSALPDKPTPNPVPRLVGYAMRLDDAVNHSDIIAVAFLTHVEGPILGPSGYGIYHDMRFKIVKFLKGHCASQPVASVLVKGDGSEALPGDGAAYIIFAELQEGGELRVLKFLHASATSEKVVAAAILATPGWRADDSR